MSAAARPPTSVSESIADPRSGSPEGRARTIRSSAGSTQRSPVP
ncbi:hypothetical protein [Streptomyces sp. ACT015]